jgi:hypothetical protein
MGRDQSFSDEIYFETHRALPQNHQFGLALENNTDASMAKGIYIRLEISCRVSDISKAIVVRAPRQAGWKTQVEKLVKEQPAIIVFDGHDLTCFHGHPIQWDNVRLVLQEHLSGYLRIDYVVSSEHPHTSRKGKLVIKLSPGQP